MPPGKNSDGNSSLFLSLRNVDCPLGSYYYALIRTTATPGFASFSFFMGHMSHIYCHFSLFICLLYVCFPFVFSVTLWSVWNTKYYFQATAWMFLAVPLLLFPYRLNACLRWNILPTKSVSIASKFGRMGLLVSIVIATCYHGGSTYCFPVLSRDLFCDEAGTRELVMSVCTLSTSLECSTAATFTGVFSTTVCVPQLILERELTDS